MVSSLRVLKSAGDWEAETWTKYLTGLVNYVIQTYHQPHMIEEKSQSSGQLIRCAICSRPVSVDSIFQHYASNHGKLHKQRIVRIVVGRRAVFRPMYRYACPFCAVTFQGQKIVAHVQGGLTSPKTTKPSPGVKPKLSPKRKAGSKGKSRANARKVSRIVVYQGGAPGLGKRA